MPSRAHLDEVDRKIVACLHADAKQTLAEVGASVGLSAAAVKRRVDRLERDGVILGYGARIALPEIGWIEALVEIYCSDRTSPGDIAGSLAGIDEILTGFTVSGEPDAIIRVRVQDIAHLERLVERLRRDRNIVRTRTMIVLSTIIERPV